MSASSVIGSAGTGAAVGALGGPIGALIGGGVGLVGGLVGELLGQGDIKKAQDAQANRLATILNIPIAQAHTMAQSQISQYLQNPQAKQAMMSSLQGMQNEADTGGLSDADKERNFQVATSQRNENNREQAAIEQNAAMRGMGGSGFSLADSLIAGQGQATRAGAEGLGIMAAANNRHLQALQNLGSMGHEVEGQGYQEAKGISDSIDNANQFNANAASRADMANVDRSKMIADAYGGEGGYDSAEAQRKRNNASGIVDTAGAGAQIGQNYGNMLDQQARQRQQQSNIA